MDVGAKLDELSLTSDEMERFSKALKDEKFREMLREYAEEISDPETRKQHEAEITALERERGVSAQFLHPKPHHVMKTTADGAEKCFINICSNDLVAKPECKPGRGSDGRLGQHWSLPYSLSAGRPHRDTKGNKGTIYDVVFHPDTLHIGEKNPKFMSLVNNTAIQGIQDAFKVKLVPQKAKLLKIKYKGEPQPSLIRRPIPGYSEKEKASEDPLPFQYPDTKKSSKSPAHTPVQSLKQQSSLVAKLPTEPHYTVKYRSVVDLQDYRCSRDSAPSPRPREIVVTVDLPSLESVRDVDLNVTERNLVLECQKPAYKLELQLSYPVDEDKGDAKFNKAKKQLTIILPVLPATNPPVDHLIGQQPQSEEQDEENTAELPSTVKPGENEILDSSCDAQLCDDRAMKMGERQLESAPDEINAFKIDSLDAQLTERANVEMPRLKEDARSEPESCHSPDQNLCTPEMSSERHSKEETDACSVGEEKEHHLGTESTEQNDIAPTTENGDQIEQYPLTLGETTEDLQHDITAGESQISQAPSNSTKTSSDPPNDPTNPSQQPNEKSAVEFNTISDENHTLDEEDIKTACFSQEPDILPEDSHKQLGPVLQHQHTEITPLVEATAEPIKKAENLCSSEQSQPVLHLKTPAILRERDPEDGSEVIISDHVTSAALSFQNSLWFELD